MTRRIEIVAFERERLVRKIPSSFCMVCGDGNQLLTTCQAAAMAQVSVRSIYRWLVDGKIHSAVTPGGHHRICRNSLLTFSTIPTAKSDRGVTAFLPGGHEHEENR